MSLRRVFSKFLKFIILLVVHFCTTLKEDTRACKNEISTTITCFSKVPSFSKSLFSFVFDSASFSSNSFLQWLSISCMSLSPSLPLFSLSLLASTCLPWKQKKQKQKNCNYNLHIIQHIKIWDQYQYLGNCPPTPPLTQRQSIDHKLGLVRFNVGLGEG